MPLGTEKTLAISILGEIRLRLKGDIKQMYGRENFHSKTPMRMVF